MAISFVVAKGFLCCQRRRSGIKIAIVVGYKGDDMRVCFWRAASGQWTKPQTVPAADLDHLLQQDQLKHIKTIKRAVDAAIEQKLVEKVWS
jgi:hypothetical protein